MRNFTLTLLACTALTFGTMGCDEGITLFPDTNGSDTTGGLDTTGTDTADTAAGTSYFAVNISDPPTISCSNNSGNHGADVDAVELIDTIGNTSVSYATNAVATWGDGNDCTGDMNTGNQDEADIYGATDGDLSGGFVALGGGFINVEFGSSEIVPAYDIQIFEVGDGDCTGCKDDTMIVGLVTSTACAFKDATCYIELSDNAVGDALIPAGGN